MHRIHITDGIVLTKRGVGEANTLTAIFTKELGLVRASARSARLSRSKLRYGLEPLTEGRFSLVRGKFEWKLTGVEKLSQRYLGVPAPRRRAAGRVARLLLRLISGEESVRELYVTVVEGLEYLARAQEEKDAENIEVVLVLRILSHLGYLPHTPDLAKFVESDFFSMELAAEAARSRARIIRAINESLSATGL